MEESLERLQQTAPTPTTAGARKRSSGRTPRPSHRLSLWWILHPASLRDHPLLANNLFSFTTKCLNKKGCTASLQLASTLSLWWPAISPTPANCSTTHLEASKTSSFCRTNLFSSSLTLSTMRQRRAARRKSMSKMWGQLCMASLKAWVLVLLCLDHLLPEKLILLKEVKGQREESCQEPWKMCLIWSEMASSLTRLRIFKSRAREEFCLKCKFTLFFAMI